VIIVLAGPPGSGKTETAKALLKQYPQMVFLDCDWFASRVPFNWSSEADVEAIYQAFSLMLNFYKQKNQMQFVMTMTAEMTEVINKFGPYILIDGLPLKLIRLRSAAPVLEKRIKSLNRSEAEVEQDQKRAIIAQYYFDMAFPTNESFYMIDTSLLSPDQAAARVVEIISTNPSQ
jgi:broad-specificity NMP kinase